MQDSKYLVATERDAQWGLVVNTVGYDEVGPDDAYPTHGHGDGYYFDIERGRTLDEYQMLYLVVFFRACEGCPNQGRRHIPAVPGRVAYVSSFAR